MDNEKLINIRKAASLLGVHVRTLMNWDRNKKLVSIRTAGGHRRYKLSEIEKIANEGFYYEKY